jgi:hypothetical protein
LQGLNKGSFDRTVVYLRGLRDLFPSTTLLGAWRDGAELRVSTHIAKAGQSEHINDGD